MSELLNEGRLVPYLEAHLPGFHGPVQIEKTPIGQSNPTFVLKSPGGRVVLRRKPPGDLLKSAHAVEREFCVMRALENTPVPVPKVYLLCEDQSVVGATFFVMEFIEGQTFLDPRCQGLHRDVRARLFNNMNAALAALHSIDIEAIGLSDFGRPGNYYARQFSRWSGQYRATETQSISEMDALMNWLEANMPPDDGRSALVHGDYRLDNMLFDAATGDLLAVLDWELSTIGHPYADLAGQIMQWAMPTGEEGRGLASVDRSVLGIPEDIEYIEAYANRMGIGDMPNFEFYVAFGFFRMAAILQGVKHRALQGNASNPQKAMKMGKYVALYAQNAILRINAAT